MVMKPYLMRALILAACVFAACVAKCPYDHFTYHNGWMNQFFDEVYTITMPQRRQYITGVMEAMGIAPNYVTAVDASVLDRDQLVVAGIVTDTCTLSTAQLACAMSHNKALQKFLDNPDAHVGFVFEDDIKKLDPVELDGAKASIYDVLSNVPRDWDVINFGRCWDKCVGQEIVGNGVLKSERALCRHAYAVTRAGAQKLIAATTPLTGSAQSDAVIASMAFAQKLNMYVPTRMVFRQNRSMLGSTLANDNAKQQECFDRR